MRSPTPLHASSPTVPPTACVTVRSPPSRRPWRLGSPLVRVLDAREADPKNIVAQLRRPGGFLSEKVRDAARRIVTDVRDRGDEALLEYTERFDGVRPDPIRVPLEEIQEARTALDGEAEEAFRVAIEKVRFFQKSEVGRPV